MKLVIVIPKVISFEDGELEHEESYPIEYESVDALGRYIFEEAKKKSHRDAGYIWFHDMEIGIHLGLELAGMKIYTLEDWFEKNKVNKNDKA